MFVRLVGFLLKLPMVSWVGAFLLIIGGVFAYFHLTIEAYPNPVPPLIEVLVQPSGWSAEEVEKMVTIPLEIGLSGMKNLEHVRSQSLFGLSDVKCYFRFGTRYEEARQEVINRLQFISLPNGLQAKLSPWNAIGEIFRYTVEGEGYSLQEKKTAQDWVITPYLKRTEGVIDITSFGGDTKQFQVEVNPIRLQEYGISLSQVMSALQNSNQNVGGERLTIGEQSYTIRGVGFLETKKDIEKVVIAIPKKIPIRIGK